MTNAGADGWPVAEPAERPVRTDAMKWPVSRPAPWATAELMASVTDRPSWTSFTATAVNRMASGTLTRTDRSNADRFCR